ERLRLGGRGLTLGQVVGVVLDHGRTATGAHTAIVMLLDARADQLEVIDHVGQPPGEMESLRTIPRDAPLPPAQVVRTQAPVWVESRADGAAQFPGFGPILDRFGDAALAALPLVAAGCTIGVLGLGFATPRAFPAEDRALMLALAQQCAQALERARLYAELQAAHARLQHLSQRLIEAQEQERRHLARELHDEVGQALTGLRLSLELVGRMPPEERAARLAEAHQATQELIARVRALSLDLRPAMLDDVGLLPALLWQVKRYSEQTGISVDLRHWGLERRFPPAVETVAYRVVQEALTNIARSAGVRTATVSLLASSTQLIVQVRDGGRGFVLAEALAGARSSGLAGMHERVSLLGGTLSIETAPGAGTCVTADLPLCEESVA
ncbi:MAG: GAF domain-containing sensor histidine kinase, partial [Chloroflexales bacterium]|nr:GAF domain-containing sensor histidine kinase [Chloroflexales bacterium]